MNRPPLRGLPESREVCHRCRTRCEVLLAAYLVGGQREIGEPAREALIVDFSPPHLRGRSVGLYYLVRSPAIVPAGVMGAMLWQIDPAVPFLRAAAVGLLGTLRFVRMVPADAEVSR